MAEYDATDDGRSSYDLAIAEKRKEFEAGQGLVAYEEACKAVALAKTANEAKDIYDKSDAMRVYARQAKNKQMEIDAAEIRIRAERRLGEILKVQKETVGLNAGGGGRDTTGARVEPVAAPPTLAEVGIDKKLSSRSQKIAAVPEDKFESMISDWQSRVEKENERVTVNLLREGERAQRDEILASAPIVWPTDKYPVIYADPPWRYENPPMGGGNRSIENHYPTMTLDEICALPVPDICMDGAVLFLWATAPKLRECMDVIDAWGFTYRTCMVWVKDRIGMGYHARNRHEMLLIAKRGQLSPPLPSDRPDSVIESPRTEHSTKPFLFYDTIDRMYPGLPKVELFSRSPREGWASWGNQADAV